MGIGARNVKWKRSRSWREQPEREIVCGLKWSSPEESTVLTREVPERHVSETPSVIRGKGEGSIVCGLQESPTVLTRKVP